MGNDPRDFGLLRTPAQIAAEAQTKEKQTENTQRRVQVWFNGILAVFTTVNAIAILYQGCIMHGELIEMRANSDLTYHLTLNAGNQAIAAGESAAVAKNTLAELQNEQRAWIDTKHTPFPMLKVGEPVYWPDKVYNLGKTPARRIKSQFRLIVVRVDSDPSFDFPKKGVGHMNAELIYPGQEELPEEIALMNETGEKMATLSKELWDKWTNHQVAFIMFANIEYWDVFGRPHFARICDAAYIPPEYKPEEKNALKKCAEYNDAN